MIDWKNHIESNLEKLSLIVSRILKVNKDIKAGGKDQA
jgi:hypothetical protein